MTPGPKWAASTSNIYVGRTTLGPTGRSPTARNPRPLLKAPRALDLHWDLGKPVGQGLGPRREAWHVNVDGDDLVAPLADRVGVLKETSAIRAASHRDDVARLGHLVVEALDPKRHFVGERTGDD